MGMHQLLSQLTTADPVALTTATLASLSNCQQAYLTHGPVSLQEVWLEEHIKQVASDALNGVINRQHMHPLAILDISALQDAGQVQMAKYVSDAAGHLDHKQPLLLVGGWDII